MGELVSAVLMVIGATFVLLGAVGVVRMPDLFTRMQPATKATTLGISCTLLAVAVYFGRSEVTTRALAAIAFFFVTTPVTAHLIGRASYFVGVPLWEGTIMDELRGNYDLVRHICYPPDDVTTHGGDAPLPPLPDADGGQYLPTR